MAPLIDMVFLLLVFFLLAANFRPPEGFLPAELPRQVTHASARSEVDPLTISVRSYSPDQCEVLIGREEGIVADTDDFSAFLSGLREVLARQGRQLDDPIRLAPAADARWEHVVKCYNAMQELQLRHIVFVSAPRSK